jgi:fibronectin type 3 domain-containing protein
MPEQPTRENYFIILDIDPDKAWVDADFDKQLIAKQTEWSRGLTNPIKKIKFQNYLDSVSQIKIVMDDSVKRAAEATAAKQILAEREGKEKKDLEWQIQLLAAKGFILDAEIENLVKAFKGRLHETFVRSEVGKCKLPNSDPKAHSSGGVDPLDPLIMNAISQNQEVLGNKDLYDFLGKHSNPPISNLGRATSIIQLKDLAEKIEKANREKAIDAKLTASNSLASLAKKAFATDEMRKRYHLALDDSKIAQLEASVKATGAVTKVIRPEQFNQLLKQAGNYEIPAKRAQDCILETAKKNGISVQLPSGHDTQIKLTCPSCGAINDDQTNCRVCGKELKITCPSCAEKVLAENGACGKCGFPVGNKAVVQEALKAIKLLITQKNLDDASERLEFASSAWSTSPPKPLKDELTTQIAEQRRALDRALDDRRKRTEEQRKHDDEQRQRAQKLRQALDDHRYYEARRILGHLDPSGKDSTHNAARKEANEAIAWAEAEFTKASERESRGEDVIDQYQAILRRCSDLKAAQDALAKSPPLPAAALNATTSDGRIVSLAWKSSTSKNVAYTVVRKTHTRPSSAADGEVITKEVMGNVYDDKTPPVGIPVYYAIYTNREGVLAMQGAILAQPIIVTAPVTNVSIKGSSGQIELKWDAPDNVSEIRIYRSESPPRNVTDGKQIAVLGTQAVDRGLVNGKRYYYTLITVFANHGKTGPSVTVEATPDEPPKPITEVHKEIKETRPGVRELHLTWDAPPKGDVVVLQSDTKPHLSVDQIIPQDKVTGYGKISYTLSNHLALSPPNNTQVYLTLLVLFQKQAYVGVTIEYVNLEDVAKLTFVREQNAFRLKWDWVASNHKCIVTYRYDNYPTAHNQQGTVRQEITKAQYDQAGGFRINRPERRNHYIVVYAVIGEGDQQVITSGLSTSARTCIVVEDLIRVDYEVRRIGRLLGRRGRLTLVLTVNGIGTLPAMQLRAKQDVQPTSKTEGEVILQIEAMELANDAMKKNSAVSLHYDLSAFERDRRLVRLFLEDDNLYDHCGGGYVHLERTSNEKVRVF